ncbi:MAG TPA: hypothetical protein VMX75_05020 [Spirochaetia bacterium]|nr:hypothetical protein [Spirochaetia bacterium]
MNERCYRDLNLEATIEGLCQNSRQAGGITEILLQLCGKLLTGQAAELRSGGLRRLADFLTILPEDPTFQNLVKELPDLMARVRNIVSVTKGVNPMLVPLFRDLSEILSRIAYPIALALKKYNSFSSQFLYRLKEEIIFYLGAVGLVRHIRSC